jgi:hypothetical protein
MFYRPGGGARQSKWWDEIFTDTSGNATAWLPCQQGDMVGIVVAKAALFASPQPNGFRIGKFSDFPTATIILELKQGRQPDSEAYGLDQWENTNVAVSVTMVQPGFFRVRAADIQGSVGSPEENAFASGIAIRVFNGRRGSQWSVP